MVEWGVVEVRVVEEWGIMVAATEEHVEEKEEEQDHPVLIHWRAIGAGCVAIWPTTVPNPVASRRK